MPIASEGWQSTPRAAQCNISYPSCTDIFIAKLPTNGSLISAATYLSGRFVDLARGLSIDPSGRVYIAGITYSDDLPVAQNALQQELLKNDIRLSYDDDTPNGFIARFNSTLNQLTYLTYYGRGATINALATDNRSSVYITGTSHHTDLPLPPDQTPATPQLRTHLYVSKLEIDQRMVSYLYRSLIPLQGGEGLAIAVNEAGEAAVAAAVPSAVVEASPLQERTPNTPRSCVLSPLQPCSLQYVIKLPSDGAHPVFATELGMLNFGGGVMRATGVTYDRDGQLYVVGQGVLPYLLPSNLHSGTGTAVKIAFDGDAPSFTSRGIVNAASFEGDDTRGGALVSIFGTGLTSTSTTEFTQQFPLPTKLAGTEVVAGGKRLPLLAVVGGEAQQVNLHFPYQSDTASALGIIRNGKLGYAIRHSQKPNTGVWGIFVVGQGLGAILHGSTYELVTESSPAVEGETLLIYGTGFGFGNLPSELPPPGQPAPTTHVVSYNIELDVTFGSLVARASFVGLAPGFVGLDQINVVVPKGIPAGKVSMFVGPTSFKNAQNILLPIR